MSKPVFTQKDVKSVLQKLSNYSYTHVQTAPVQIPHAQLPIETKEEPVILEPVIPIPVLREEKPEVALAPLRDPLPDLLDEQKKRFVTEIENYKKRLLFAFSEKKELEAKISEITCEKSTLLARLHELSQKSKTDSHGKEELASILEVTKRALDEANSVKEQLEKRLHLVVEERDVQHELLKERTEVYERTQKDLQELQETHESMVKALKQELSVSQACVIERQAAFEAEHKKHRELCDEWEKVKNELHERKEKLSQIEQHLARRIKECSIFARKLDSETKLRAELQNSLSDEIQRYKTLENDYDILKKTHTELAEEYRLKTAQYEEKIAAIESQNEAQARELEVMRKLKSRLQQLEALYAQFGQIVAPNPAPFSLLTKDIPADTKPQDALFEYHER